MYLHSKQGSDGAVAAPGVTEDFIFGAAAAGIDPSTLAATGGTSAYDYLAVHAAAVAGDAGASGKLSLAVLVGRLDPSTFGGQDLLADLGATYHPATGVYGDGQTFPQALAILAFVAAADAGHPVPAAAVTHLQDVQNTDGSWNYLGVKDAPGGSDTNSTAIAIQALVAAGVPKTDPSITAALASLKSQQLGDGGFPYSDAFGPPASDPDSDAIVIQALVAAGQDAAGAAWTKGGHTPRQNMLTFRDAATGGFTYPGNPGPDAFTTSQVPAGLVGVPFPGNRDWTPGTKLPAGTCAVSAPSSSPTARPSPSRTGGTEPGVTPPSTSSATGDASAEAPTGAPALIVLIFAVALLVATRRWTRRTSR